MPTTPQTASENVAPCGPPTWARAVKLFRNGANQAVRIPREFELPSTDVLNFREGTRLILEQAGTHHRRERHPHHRPRAGTGRHPGHRRRRISARAR
ncbi:MAG: AbrB/MazE/SpoVT family DNA-binding domain-containing protein, partial [Burkholderiaceae bacterium]|nr:AbrB/MazE/SpoVT family DNA-binding domain-containing protein [Burkholderiaceae bacterium]